jgi:maltose alpha-D-glucosyltransferase/alpha-amylase
LRHVLWTGKDFVFFDFAGDSSVSISERRIKRSPLRDAATMVRSFHYAAYAGLNQHLDRGGIPRENLHKFEPWIRYWNHWIGISFFQTYLKELETSKLLPEAEVELRDLIQIYLLNQAVSELRDQLLRAPSTAVISLRAILHLMEKPAPSNVGGAA